jgi:aryl-alcohol dehydrogenase-like predicted oxidoreductase
MDFRRVGSSDVEISRVGLGGYQLGPEAGDSPDVDRAALVVRAAIASGVNWLDTSENYLGTKNEAVIGDTLERVGKEFLVASKVAPRAAITGGASGFKRAQVLQACRNSLSRLRLDHLDVYFLHSPDDSGVPLEETWGAMAELVGEGLVRTIGLSNYELADVERCHAQRPVDAVQVGLSLIDYLEHRSYVASCAELGIAVTIYEPVAGGVLTGRTLDQVRAAWQGPWRESQWYKRVLAPGPGERSLAVADGLRPIAERLNATVAQVAIAWVLHQTGVTAAIAGSRDERHMRDNAAAAALDLSDVLSEIERLIPLGPTFATTTDAG